MCAPYLHHEKEVGQVNEPELPLQVHHIRDAHDAGLQVLVEVQENVLENELQVVELVQHGLNRDRRILLPAALEKRCDRGRVQEAKRLQAPEELAQESLPLLVQPCKGGLRCRLEQTLCVGGGLSSARGGVGQGRVGGGQEVGPIVGTE